MMDEQTDGQTDGRSYCINIALCIAVGAYTTQH